MCAADCDSAVTWSNRFMSYAIFQLLGFFAGIHLAILAAYVCQKYPNASVNGLFTMFFEIFANWPWQIPVDLHGQPFKCRRPDGCLMPIVMPCTPPELCVSNMTEGTFRKIREELMRGYTLTKVSKLEHYML
jgi:poly(A) polymerase